MTDYLIIRIIDVHGKAVTFAAGAAQQTVDWPAATPQIGDVYKASITPVFILHEKLAAGSADIVWDRSDSLRWRKPLPDGQTRMDVLAARHKIKRALRDYFDAEGFLEIDMPLLVRGTTPDAEVPSFRVEDRYLVTSCEYQIKRMEIGGFDKLYTLTQNFRAKDHGAYRNPEFTMLEYYRTEADMFVLMDDLDQMLNFIIKNCSGIFNFQFSIFKRISMKDLWQKTININLDEYLTREKMWELCKEKKYNVENPESYEELFYRIFLQEIEPKLKDMGVVIVYNYPAKMASLSKLSEINPNYAERFEVYIDGLELANAFSELTNKDEQLKRLQEEQKERERQGKKVYKIDMEFIEAVGQMPNSAGIALGVDRLVQVLTSCQNIDSVLTLPSSKLF